MWMFAVVVLWAGEILTQSVDEFLDVKIAQGVVRGHLDPEGEVYSFYDIPYANVPTGPNRFKAPLDPPVWMHTFDAVNRNIVCPQSSSSLNVQENCLVASVFVPGTNATNLPVLVHVHGGAYFMGYGNSNGFNTLVRTQKLIVVTFNYRLGVHGFLCLGTEDAPGNAGLKDQIAALRWIQTNIASFGGNPLDVTLIGCSAGGGAIDFLTISEITDGLFNKAITGSGSVFGYVGPQANPLATAKNYASSLSFDNVNDLEALEEFYKTASLEWLNAQFVRMLMNTNGTISFTPCIERDVGQEMVLTDAPINIINQGKYRDIPLIYGFANMEGLFAFSVFDLWKHQMNEKFSDFLPGELHFESEEVKEKVAETVKTFYFGDKPVGEETILGYIDYFSDVLFNYPMLKALTARVESRNDNIYLFEYSFVDNNTPDIPHTDIKGSSHCEQLRPVTDIDTSDATEEYTQMQSIVQEYWLNFILSGAPSVQGSALEYWPPANASRSPYMSIGQVIQLKDSLMPERAALWDSIYAEYYRAPIPPTGSAASSMIPNFLILACYSIMLFNILI